MASVPLTVRNADGQKATSAFSYGGGPIVVPPGDHGYFDLLCAHLQFWKGYSLRPKVGEPVTSPHYAKQLLGKALGGYAEGTSFYDITYDPAHDTDPQAQDAAKITIAIWDRKILALEAPLAPNDTKLTASFITKSGWKDHSLKFASGEIVRVMSFAALPTLPVTYELTLQRRTFGTTTPGVYPVGTTFLRNTPSLQNNVFLPLGTQDGFTYLFSYDFYLTNSCVNPLPHDFPIKSFQFKSSNKADATGAIWLEQRIIGRMQSATQVGTWNFRSYNRDNSQPLWQPDMLGPGVNKDPLGPQLVTPYALFPARRYRVWVRVEQRANDYDLMSSWIADKPGGVKQIHNQLQISVRPFNIAGWWIELNSSDDELYNEIVKVLYLQNFAALRWPGVGADVTPLLRTEGL